MSDSYQATYDAVRSRIGGVDVGQVVAEAARNAFDISHLAQCVVQDIAGHAYEVSGEHRRPSAVFRPDLRRDGNQWCALYGADLQVGVAGFGDTPADAMAAFDKAWSEPIPSPV